MTPWQEIERIASAQHGLFTLQQALVAGLSSRTIQRHVDARGCQRVLRGVMALPGSLDTPAQHAKAVELAIGRPVLISGWTAAFLWGLLPKAPSVVDVMVPADRKAPALRRVRPTRCSLLAPQDEAVVDGIVVTAVPLTLIVVARSAALPYVRGLVIDARQRRLTSVAVLRECVDRLGNSAGTGKLRRVLADLDEQRPDSVFEYLVRDRLRRDGFIPQPDPEPCAVPLRNGRTLHVDVPFSPYRVGLECDGFGSHHERSSLDIDALRLNALADADWLLLRVTWSIYEHHWSQLLTQLSRMLAGRGAAVPRPARD